MLATHNKHKIEEIAWALHGIVEVKGVESIGFTTPIEENGHTLEENALLKAEAVYTHCPGSPVLADDSGLEVEALDMAPGVYSARWAGEPADSGRNIDKLLGLLDGQENRSARFRTVLCAIYRGEAHYFTGIVEGHICTERRGKSGFGYDPVFIPNGYPCTFAEMDLAEKNQISHRARAIQAFVECLKNQWNNLPNR